MNTKLEGWVNLFLNSKRIFSQVHDVHRNVQAAEENEELKEEHKEDVMSSFDNNYTVKSQRSEIGQSVTDNAGKICKLWPIHL